MAARLYLTPQENGGIDHPNHYGPKYFNWRFGDGYPWIEKRIYGFIGVYLVLADLTPQDHIDLTANADVFTFPLDLDTNIAQGDMEALRALFEGFNIPADWLTAANTYRQLLRQCYGMFRFATRYARVAGDLGAPVGTTLFSAIDLDTKYRDFPASVQVWFEATVTSYGLDPAIIKPNSDLRQMLKQASDYLAQPMPMGGVIY